MKTSTFKLRFNIIPLLGVLCFFFNLFGCATGFHSHPEKEKNTLELPPASLPEYTIGVKYIYSNGTWEKVIGLNNTIVEWENHRGNRKFASVDFTQRPFEWETRKRKGKRSTEPAIYIWGKQNRSIWPLQLGNSVNYREKSIWQEKGRQHKKSSSFWRCTVEESVRLSVAAGEFDTWKIVCGKFKDQYRAIDSTSREYKTFYYSPTIQHWVKIQQEYRSSLDKVDRSKELVAILPDLSSFDKNAVVGLQKNFQWAMEKNKQSVPSVWKRKRDNLVMETRPLRSYWKEGRIPCRQYSQTITQNNTTYQYFGMACRDKEGKWKIPRKE